MMNEKLMKNIFVAAILWVGLALIASSQEPDLRIEIKTEQASVKTGEQFPVLTRILNISNRKQNFYVWSCSFSKNWDVDNSNIILDGEPCRENGPSIILLKPKEAYERKLSLYVASKYTGQDSTFKLGFKTFKLKSGELVISPAGQAELTEPLWSNAVTMKIKENN